MYDIFVLFHNFSVLLTLAVFMCIQTKVETQYLQPFNDFPYCVENKMSRIEKCFKYDYFGIKILLFDV